MILMVKNLQHTRNQNVKKIMVFLKLQHTLYNRNNYLCYFINTTFNKMSD